MTSSYKIGILLAVLLCGGIVSYHWLQSGDVRPGPVAVDQPPRSGAGGAQGADDAVPAPGIGELMTRIRSHIDQANRGRSTDAPQTTVPIERQPSPPDPDDAQAQTPPPPVQERPPATPTLTFGQRPPQPQQVVAPSAAALPQPRDAGAGVKPPSPAQNVVVENSKTPDRGDAYTIQSGDTFSTIALKIYGSQDHWIDIATANPFVDPKRLKVGQSIRLPSPDDILGGEQDEAVSESPGRMITHVVRSGDSLSSIAQKYYDNPSQWRVIFNTNRDRIGHDPDRLRAGEVLRIPPQHMPAR